MDIYVDERIRSYARALIAACSADARIEEAFIERAKVVATQAQRRYVTPQDIKSVSFEVLRAVVVLPPNARSRDLSPDDFIRECLDHVPVP
jgi:MoxR-like ATPase